MAAQRALHLHLHLHPHLHLLPHPLLAVVRRVAVIRVVVRREREDLVRPVVHRLVFLRRLGLPMHPLVSQLPARQPRERNQRRRVELVMSPLLARLLVQLLRLLRRVLLAHRVVRLPRGLRPRLLPS